MYTQLTQPRDESIVPIICSASRRSPSVELATILSSTVAGHDLTCRRAELPSSDAFDHHHCMRPFGDEAGVQEIAGEHTEQAIPELFVVDQHAVGEEPPATC